MDIFHGSFYVCYIWLNCTNDRFNATVSTICVYWSLAEPATVQHHISGRPWGNEWVSPLVGQSFHGWLKSDHCSTGECWVSPLAITLRKLIGTNSFYYPTPSGTFFPNIARHFGQNPATLDRIKSIALPCESKWQRGGARQALPNCIMVPLLHFACVGAP